MGKYNEKYFHPDNEMNNNQIEDLLNEGEEIIWRGKPKLAAFIWSKVFNMLPFALLWACFDGFVIYGLVTTDALVGVKPVYIAMIVGFFVVHLAPVWIWLANVLSSYAQCKNQDYAFTTSRIIIRTGIIVDIKTILYADVVSVDIRVGLVDRLFKVGDIYITAKNGKAVLWDIENPYKVFNMLQKVVNDIKTDIYYPNELRPKENSGYNTKYKIKKDEE